MTENVHLSFSFINQIEKITNSNPNKYTKTVFLFCFLFSVASDASGRYRGQFLFDNNYWLGSQVICDDLEKINEIRLGFYIATVAVHSPEPLMRVCMCVCESTYGMCCNICINAMGGIIQLDSWLIYKLNYNFLFLFVICNCFS